MRTIKIALIIIISSFAVNAQENSKYEILMNSALEQWQKESTIDEKIKLTSLFEKIGNLAPDQWLPYYYCALNNVNAALQTKDPKAIVAYLETAEGFITQAMEISPENSELFVLKAICANAKTMVDPSNKTKLNNGDAAMYLDKAKQINIGNPRAYLVEAQMKLYTPEAMGGGKKIALQCAEKALSLFNDIKQETKFMPAWGKEQAQNLMQHCK
jgi:uncharacterized protein (DUF1778 family)